MNPVLTNTSNTPAREQTLNSTRMGAVPRLARSCLVAMVTHQLEGRYQQYKNKANAKVKVTGTYVYTEIAVTRFMQSMPILRRKALSCFWD